MGVPSVAGDGWTRDKRGGLVDWTGPPYYNNGRLCTLLEGEQDITPDEHWRRVAEYLDLARGLARIVDGELVRLDPNRLRFEPTNWRAFLTVIE